MLALEDAIDVTGRAAVRLDCIWSVREQAAIGDEVAGGIHRGQSVPSRERDDQVAMRNCPSACRHYQAAIRLTRKSSDSALKLAGIKHADRPQF